MTNVIQTLYDKKLIQPPSWLVNNTMFLGLTGSISYGCAGEASDMDIVGFCVPPKDLVFPHLAGEIPGFGSQKKPFEQFQQHHVQDKETSKEYDLTVYNIVKFFNLTMQNNPNMVDVLFLPERCVIHSTSMYRHVRSNRQMFLHKGCFHKFSGYAFSQMNKIRNKKQADNPKRQASIDEYGYDLKFGYHVVRLLLEADQILNEHDLDLERNSEILKSIRRGEWSLEKLEDYMNRNERALQAAYDNSTLRHSPDEEEIKQLLMQCLEMHYGSLQNAVQQQDKGQRLVNELEQLVNKYR